VFERIPTEFGPVSLRFRLDDEARRLEVDYRPALRRRPLTVTLHVPPVENLRAVSVNGANLPAMPGGAIVLPPDR
ncbi:MAG: hypothetical protein HRF43_10425, partial [Phycisphaerae bacterium]|jgi:hypothetical protein